MATTPPKDTPFGLEPNVAAGLAYLFGIVGGLVMLFGGGTNKFVKWAGAQSITLWVALVLVWIVYFILATIIGHIPILGALVDLLLYVVLWLASVGLWLWTAIMGFQGKEVRVPVVADLTQQIFGSQLG